MRLFIALRFDENTVDKLVKIQDELKSERGKNGMIYTEIGCLYSD